MAGVPPAGFPKTSSFVSRRAIPTRCASPLWSTTTKSLAPAARIAVASRSTVSATGRGLRLETTPLVARGPVGPASDCDPILFLHHQRTTPFHATTYLGLPFEELASGSHPEWCAAPPTAALRASPGA